MVGVVHHILTYQVAYQDWCPKKAQRFETNPYKPALTSDAGTHQTVVGIEVPLTEANSKPSSNPGLRAMHPMHRVEAVELRVWVLILVVWCLRCSRDKD